MENEILRKIDVGFRLWVLKSVGLIILILPTYVLYGKAFTGTSLDEIMNLSPQILLTLFISFIIGLFVNGWLLSKYKRWVLKNG